MIFNESEVIVKTESTNVLSGLKVSIPLFEFRLYSVLQEPISFPAGIEDPFSILLLPEQPECRIIRSKADIARIYLLLFNRNCSMYNMMLQRRI